ncbi:MAG: 23S rRNA (guanosine(2251)-2'-O)-methyltransferase RlmB, partial [Anaerolineae bacterium]|nr:23S rRNA (guanosine(2251)-2'-O)-methyltransferase RlmB [Anaerolineae bacterium]
LYGRNAVREALLAGRRTAFGLWVLAGRRDARLQEIGGLARARGVPVSKADRHRLGQLAGDRHHQGVALEVSPYPYLHLEDILARAQEAGEPPFLLLLDLLQDPQNVGTLLRTAEAVGVHGVVLGQRRAAGVTPAVVHTSSGATEWLAIARVPNLSQAMRTLSEQGVWLVGLEGLPEATPLDQVAWPQSVAVVVGSEGEGLRRLTREWCDLLVRIPMRGHITSLNAAVAGSIALYAAWRARGK